MCFISAELPHTAAPRRRWWIANDTDGGGVVGAPDDEFIMVANDTDGPGCGCGWPGHACLAGRGDRGDGGQASPSGTGVCSTRQRLATPIAGFSASRQDLVVLLSATALFLLCMCWDPRRAVWPRACRRRGCVPVGGFFFTFEHGARSLAASEPPVGLCVHGRPPLLGRAERRFFRVVVSPMPVPAVVVAMWGGVRASAAGALARFWAKAQPSSRLGQRRRFPS